MSLLPYDASCFARRLIHILYNCTDPDEFNDIFMECLEYPEFCIEHMISVLRKRFFKGYYFSKPNIINSKLLWEDIHLPMQLAWRFKVYPRRYTYSHSSENSKVWKCIKMAIIECYKIGNQNTPVDEMHKAMLKLFKDMIVYKNQIKH